MTDKEVMEWLFETGGPTIKYRTATELMNVDQNLDGLVDDLLKEKEIASLLQRLDGYEPIKTVDSRTLNAVHSGTGVEAIVAKLIELGMRSGIYAFDSRMQVFRQYVGNEFVDKAFTSPCGLDVADNRAVFIAVLVASYFVHAGYEYEEVVSFLKKRIDLLYRIALEKQYEIFLSETELQDYPKRPKFWAASPVICPEYDPGGSKKPLPLIHDIFCLAYLPKIFIDNDIESRINKIIEYVLDERFQALPLGYGLVYYKKGKTYYGMGWRPELPCLNNFNSEYEKSILILYMELMANFKKARESQWFMNCYNYLGQFKTSKGTYCLPPGYLKNIKNNGYVCGMSMGLGQNRRLANAYEIESTFHMLLIKKRSGLI